MISFYLFLFILGLIVGSFLNCLIYRLEISGQGGLKKMVFGRSFCPDCRHTLAWHDLIPVLSFVFLAGKCRYCQKRISIQYPLVELATGVLFVFIFSTFGGSASGGQFLNLLFLLFISSCLIVIFVFDSKHYLIPDEIIYPAIVTVFIYSIFRVLDFGNWNFIGNWKLVIGNLAPLLNPLASAVLASAFFFVIYTLSKGHAMGFGDVKLAFLMGLFLGFPNIVVALFFAFFTGALTGLRLMILKKKTLKSELPFGPFLVLGTLFALFWGGEIFNLYINLLAL